MSEIKTNQWKSEEKQNHEALWIDWGNKRNRIKLKAHIEALFGVDFLNVFLSHLYVRLAQFLHSIFPTKFCWHCSHCYCWFCCASVIIAIILFVRLFASISLYVKEERMCGRLCHFFFHYCFFSELFYFSRGSIYRLMFVWTLLFIQFFGCCRCCCLPDVHFIYFCLSFFDFVSISARYITDSYVRSFVRSYALSFGRVWFDSTRLDSTCFQCMAIS